jgi:hypothetical protein
MTTAVPLPDGKPSGRLQAALALAALVAAVLVTAVLVTVPATPDAKAPAPDVTIPPGVRVDVTGGDPFVAYALADRLAERGASLRAVSPAADAKSVASSTSIVYYERRQVVTAEKIRQMLGQGTLRREQVFEPVVDVTIVLGKDLARA